jgi:hypothetical protein
MSIDDDLSDLPDLDEPLCEGDCLCPNQLARDLDRELRRLGIVFPSLVSEFTMERGGEVHLGVTSVECARELLQLLRRS